MLPKGRVPREPDNPSAKVWASLAALIALLVFIVLARDRLAAGAAGCYQQSSATGSSLEQEQQPGSDESVSTGRVRITPDFSVARQKSDQQ